MSTQSETTVIEQEEIVVQKPNKYNVIFWNDDFTPADFVVQLLYEIFNKTETEAISITNEVHNNGKGIAGTYNFETAYTKQSEAVTISRQFDHPLRITLEKA